MDNPDARPHIRESFLERRQFFADPWVERWINPNPFVSAVISPRSGGWSRTQRLLLQRDERRGELSQHCDSKAERVFIAANPYWEVAPQLVSVFDQISDQIRQVVGVPPKPQEATLAFQVTPGASDFGKITASLVNKDVVGECLFYGVSLHRSEGVLVIDKSLRYEGAAFVPLQRVFGGDVMFAEVAAQLYEAEIAALRLLGLPGVP